MHPWQISMRPFTSLLAVGLLASGLGATPAIARVDTTNPTAEVAEVDGVTFAPYQAYRIRSFAESSAVGDFTGDGLLDVAVSTNSSQFHNHDFQLWLFRQKGDGTLRDPVTYATGLDNDDSVGGLAAGDLDGDGRTDLALATSDGAELFMQRDGTFAPPVLLPSPGADQVLIEDIMGGHRPEIVLSSHLVVDIFRNEHGAFVEWGWKRMWSWELEVGDLTNDGRPDLVSTNNRGVDVRPQTPQGRFGPAVTYVTARDRVPMGLEVADITGDGLGDAIVNFLVVPPGYGLNVFRGRPNGALAKPVKVPSYDSPQAIDSVDLDGDGRSDVVTLHDYTPQAGVYLQRSDGTLGPEQLVPTPSSTSYYHLQALSFGDVNGDGTTDVVFADRETGLVVLPQVAPGTGSTR
jgi:hypothetical protein